MLFKPDLVEKILSGHKTQTRRVVKQNEDGVKVMHGEIQYVMQTTVIGDPPIDYRDRIKWQRGKTYAIQPGRGKKSVGRFHLLRIRCEPLHWISPSAVYAEGIPIITCVVCNGYGSCTYCEGGADTGAMLDQFINLWDRINKLPGTQWVDNPEVWILEFELVK